MSFGCSVGDFVTVGQLAWRVYKSCKEAPESFANISSEVLSLHLLLKEVEELLQEELSSDQHSLAPKVDNLTTIVEGCQDVLRELEAITTKYEGLGLRSKWTWDRMRWGSGNIAELRQRLTSNVVMLNAFISTSQIVVQRKLNNYVRECQEGRHEGSHISVATLESLTSDDKMIWREIRKELESIGISVASFDANKDFILEWFKKALEEGAFEELGPDDDSITSDSSRLLTQYSKELYIYPEHLAREKEDSMLDAESEKPSDSNAQVTDGKGDTRPKYEGFAKPRPTAEGTVIEYPSHYPKSTVLSNSPTTSAIISRGRPNKQRVIEKQLGNERTVSDEEKAFEYLPTGHRPEIVCQHLSSLEVKHLRLQACGQASRFEVLSSNDVQNLSQELRALDARCEYLRNTHRSLRNGRRNLHTRIVNYLRSPRTARFSHESMLKQEEALAELDSSIDDWVSKLEIAENRRMRVRQKLLEHIAAALIIPGFPNPLLIR